MNLGKIIPLHHGDVVIGSLECVRDLGKELEFKADIGKGWGIQLDTQIIKAAVPVQGGEPEYAYVELLDPERKGFITIHFSTSVEAV